jgi:hypothetical protein
VHHYAPKALTVLLTLSNLYQAVDAEVQDRAAEAITWFRRSMVSRILAANGDDRPLGHNWMAGFFRRNPRVHTIVGRSLEAARAEAANPDVICEWLELFERQRVEYNVSTADTWNVDETGVALGVCNNSRVVKSATKCKANVKSPEDREWVSSVECISAAGRVSDIQGTVLPAYLV